MCSDKLAEEELIGLNGAATPGFEMGGVVDKTRSSVWRKSREQTKTF